MKKETRLPFTNRELSWMDFNARVLEEAYEKDNPVLERFKFLGITASNLDEFFMVRVAGVKEQVRSGYREPDNAGLAPQQQLTLLSAKIHAFVEKQYTCLSRSLIPLLRQQAFFLLRAEEWNEDQRSFADDYFRNVLFPVLTPLAVDRSRPFPMLSNKSLNLGIRLKREGELAFAVVQVPSILPRLVELPCENGRAFVLLETIIEAHLAELFELHDIEAVAAFRVTRNADFDTNVDDADLEHDFDFSKYMKRKVGMRSTLDAVRLEIDKNSDRLRSFVLKNLDLKKSFCFKVEHYLDYKFLFSLGKYFPEEKLSILKYPPFKGRVASELMPPVSLIERVKERDVFLAYPFDSMDPLVRLLNECADDKRVVSIKITIYRLDNHSRIVEALKRASENGKEVTVVIELCARFDEENNMYFAGILQEAGCTIIYGMQNYKVHSKIISVLLSENGEIGYITHLGTGNYNESTSKQYTDLNIITADREIGEDAAAFFRNIAICNTEYHYDRLLIAPQGLKKGLLKCIDEQIELAKAGGSASIVAKMNSLTDRQMIDRLYLAGKSGVKISLIVRGICCLLPGIPGETDNIRIVSIVGRFLEHSRIYCFGEGAARKMYISSADLMTRNTDKRVEIATPVLDKRIEEKIFHMLTVMLSDNIKARVFLPDGGYRKTEQVGVGIDSQNEFLLED